MQNKSPASGLEISKGLLQRQYKNGKPVDPLLHLYIMALLQSGAVQAHELMDGLSEIYRVFESSQHTRANTPKKFLYRLELQKCVIDNLHDCISGLAKDLEDASVIKTLRAIADWMTTLVTQNTNTMMFNASERIGDIMQDAMLIRQSLGLLLVTIADNQNFVDVLHSGLSSGAFNFFFSRWIDPSVEDATAVR